MMEAYGADEHGYGDGGRRRSAVKNNLFQYFSSASFLYKSDSKGHQR
jgi:hypothetical protein